MSKSLAPHLLQRRILVQGIGSALIAPGLVACGGSPGAGMEEATPQEEEATPQNLITETPPIDPVPDTPLAERKIAHLGLLHTADDLIRMAEKVANNEQPWMGSWKLVLDARRANLGATPYPVEQVNRGVAGDENYGAMIVDMLRAYHLALRWHITGDEAYAKDAVMFLNAWASTLKRLGGNSNVYLSSGLYGNQWANAAELMRHYQGWAQEDIARFQNMLLEVFYAPAIDFLTTHSGNEVRKVTHHWANWDLANLCAVMAIGVFCDRADIVSFAINYYKRGRGTGSSLHHVYFVHPGHLGQWQETHRDQGHSTLGIALAGMFCEMAWHQGEDLYGYWNNRLLAGAEYVARTNQTDPTTMPFTPYHGVQGKGIAVAGTGSRRPCWELIYNHYVNRKGLSAPWTKAMLETATIDQNGTKVRPERGDGGDSIGFGSLFFYRQPLVAPANPSGLTAHLSSGKVVLSWWGSADATHYLVQRAPARGPFKTIAQVVEPRTHTDQAPSGTWYYRIIAVSGTTERIGVDVVRVAVPGELWLHLPMNGSVDDVSGKGRHAKLLGDASYGEGRTGGGAVLFDGRTGHVALPDGALSELSDFTFAVWVYSESTAPAVRIFDFGHNDVAYIALTTHAIRADGTRGIQLLASRDQFWAEQPLFAEPPLPTGRWVHVAVTLSGTVGTIYVNGVPVASHNEIWISPYQLGHTSQTWLGRSQYGGDAYFKGRMQDLRIYSGALNAARIAELAI